MKRRELLRGLGGLGLLTALAGCAPAYPSPALRIATGSPDGEYYPLGVSLAQAWSDELHLDTAPVVSKTDGSLANVQQLTNGGVHVAISQLDVATDAYQRLPVGDASLRALARIYDDVVHVVVPRDSPIRSLTQLRGHAVSVGGSTSGVLFVVRRLLPVIGLSVADLAPPVYSGLTDSVAALRAGRIEAFFWVGALATPGITKLAREVPLRLVDMGDAAKQVQSRFPVYAPGRIAANTYAGIEEPVTTLSIRNLLLVRAEMLDALAHDLVKAMFARQPQIAAANAPALTIDPRRAIGTAPVPLHPGAVQWFREAKDGG